MLGRQYGQFPARPLRAGRSKLRAGCRQPQKSTITAIDSVGRRYRVAATLQPSQTYRLVVDSAYFRDIYGNVNKNTTFDFNIKNKDVYERKKLTLQIKKRRGKSLTVGKIK